MSPQERKRQGYIHELMETEEKYVEDLQIVLEVTQRFKGFYLSHTHTGYAAKCWWDIPGSKKE